MEQSVQVDIRWRDLDVLGHVNQSVYHELLEEGRAALIEESDTLAFVLARVELDYVKEVRREHGPVTITSRVLEVGAKKILIGSDLFRASGELAARGVTVMVCWDPVARASRLLTEAERATLGG